MTRREGGGWIGWPPFWGPVKMLDRPVVVFSSFTGSSTLRIIPRVVIAP